MGKKVMKTAMKAKAAPRPAANVMKVMKAKTIAKLAAVARQAGLDGRKKLTQEKVKARGLDANAKAKAKALEAKEKAKAKALEAKEKAKAKALADKEKAQ